MSVPAAKSILDKLIGCSRATYRFVVQEAAEVVEALVLVAEKALALAEQVAVEVLAELSGWHSNLALQKL